MKKTFLTIIGVVAMVVLTSAKPVGDNNTGKRTIYAGIAFYNQENLFDTIHDEHKNDYDFLPNGSYHWDGMKYKHKLHNMATVLSQLCTERVKGGAAFIGLSEVENERCLNDLLAQPELAERGMKGILVEGIDTRGIDVACIYNPKMFKLISYELKLPYIKKDGKEISYKEWSDGHTTRGVLHVYGNLLGEKMHILVNHWPSRGAASPAREFMGTMCRQLVDSLQAIEPDARIVLMGDLNDDPDNASVTETFGAKLSKKKIAPTDFYNPWHTTLRKQGQGTLLYDGMWNLFDQIMFTANLLGEDRSTFKFFKNEIYMPEFMTQTEGKYKGAPKRTTAGGVWQNGYSDHFPTQIYLVKEI